jgi:hypothetical protein
MMEKQFKFRIQSLLTQKDGKVSGPMSPMLFAEEMAKSNNTKFNRLARLWFDDERINQRYEDGGLTGFDTLIIGTVYDNDTLVTLWVDLGTGGIPIAMGYLSDKEVLFTQVYQKEKFAKKLAEAEVQQIFESVFANGSQLDIREDGI